MLLTLTLSLIIGLLLGLLGGGGSILTVPMLVYMLHVEPKTAITTSFVVVGLSSLLALIPHAKRHSVCWKSGVFFGVSGMVGAFAGGRIAAFLTSDLLMSLFGLISLTTGLLMFRKGKPQTEQVSCSDRPMPVCPFKVPYLRLLFDGFFVGALTGMVGVGGGFLIVPALTLLVGLPMPGAVGTSLMIIVMNALAGLGGYIQHAELNIPLTVQVAAGALVGSGIGAVLSGYVKPAMLRRGFGLMVVGVGIYVLSQALTAELFADVEVLITSGNSEYWELLALVAVLVLLRIGSWIHKTEAVVFESDNVSERR